MRFAKCWAFGLLLAGISWSGASLVLAAEDDQSEVKKWAETEVRLPAFPHQERLMDIYVSPTARNRFYVDPDSISVGDDGVVRYTLVILSEGGAANISFEGMRCETRERRLYAFGRTDGTWSKARSQQWEQIREAVANRHHAALFQEYFCPSGVIANSPEEIKDALRRGGHPSAMRLY